MLLPAIQHGDWPEVRRRMQGVVRRLMRGESFNELMTEDGKLDTSTTEGMLVVQGTLRPGTLGFYTYVPWKPLFDSLPGESGTEIEDQVFESSLATSWGVLGLMSPSCTLWFTGRPQREEPFLRAALKFWDEIDAVGPRYLHAFQGERLWAIYNGLKHVLARAGVPKERLREPLPPEGPAALLKYTRLTS